MKIGKYSIRTSELTIVFSGILVLFTLYCLAWVPPQPYAFRGCFTALCILVVLANRLPGIKSKAGKIAFISFGLMALVGMIYPVIFENEIIARLYKAGDVDVYIFIIFMIGLLGIMSRMEAGPIISVMVVIAIAYVLWGQVVPGFFGHKAFTTYFTVSRLYLDIDQGTFGLFVEVGCRLISIFFIFAALLITTGLGDVFNSAATWLAGNATGGPAKVSVFSSGLFGMISGSSTANVAATGSFTIPTMKSVGYAPSTAAAVEVRASAGGGLMPPVMGSAAFIMAEILGIPYLTICLAAIVPVCLWYYTSFLSVHYYAKGHELRKWRPSTQEAIRVIRGKGHLIVALFVLVGALYYFVVAEQGAFWAVIFLLVLTNIRKGTRLDKAKIVNFLKMYGRMFCELQLLCVGLGIFIAAMLGTGVHTKIGMILLSGIEQWYFIILIGAGLTIMLGMALPILPAYLGAVTILAPILIGMGHKPLVVHMFVLFFATLAPLTPPVCLATFAAARIAGASIFKTAMEATGKGLPLWIIPFILFRKELFLGVGTPLSVICIAVAIICIGIFLFVIGAEGYFQRKLRIFERGLAMLVGIMIVQPLSDLYSWIFIGIAVLFVIYCFLSRRFEKA